MKNLFALSALALALNFGAGVLPIENLTVVPTTGVAYAEAVEEITEVGFGYPPAGKPIGQAMILARRAAIVDAQRNLVGRIKSTSIDANTNVEDAITQSDFVRAKISGMIRGARVVSEEQLANGAYQVVMSVPACGVGSVADVAISQKLQNEGVAAPRPVPAPSPAAVNSYTPAPQAAMGAGYTGIVIDARGTALVRTYCPVIYDTNGRAIYGVHNVDRNFAISQGVVEYAEGAASWQQMGMGNSRAGSNPLIVSVVSLKERCVNKCDVIISVADADKILIENQRSGMLNRYAVVFGK